MEKENLLKIYDNFLAIDWPGIISPLKIISVIFSIFLILFIFFILFKIRKNIKKDLLTVVESVTASDLPKKELDKEWESVMNKLEKDNESDYKLAIIEADQILDNMLIKKGINGEDMGERLKQVTNQQIPNLDSVWQAHKLRNRIAHESNIRVTKRQAEQAIEDYKRAVDDLRGL